MLFGVSLWTLAKLVKEIRGLGKVYFQDGELPNYFKALRKESLEEFLSDETDFQTYGFRLLRDESYEKCEEALRRTEGFSEAYGKGEGVKSKKNAQDLWLDGWRTRAKDSQSKKHSD